MMLPRSKRRTMPVMISPLRSLYSLKTFSRSASRTRWMMTCFAVCAAMRPNAAAVGLELEEVAELLVLVARLGLVLRAVEDLEDELVAGLHLEALLVRDRHRDHVHRVGERALLGRIGHDREDLEEIDLPLVLVVAGLQVPLHPEVALRGAADGLLEDLDEPGAVDALVLRDLVEDEVEVHVLLHRSVLPPKVRLEVVLEVGLRDPIVRDAVYDPVHVDLDGAVAIAHEDARPVLARRRSRAPSRRPARTPSRARAVLRSGRSPAGLRSGRSSPGDETSRSYAGSMKSSTSRMGSTSRDTAWQSSIPTPPDLSTKSRSVQRLPCRSHSTSTSS